MRRAALVLVLTLVACETSRTRPGPPTITIDPPVGSTVFSPDTLDFVVRVQDPDGVDSLAITVLDTTKQFATDFDTETTVEISILVPSGMLPGSLIKIYARATDLTGEATLDSATITVIKRPP